MTLAVHIVEGSSRNTLRVRTARSSSPCIARQHLMHGCMLCRSHIQLCTTDCELMTGTESTATVDTSQVPEQPDPAAGDAATNPIVTTAIDGSGTAAEVDLRQPAVLADGQARDTRLVDFGSCLSYKQHLGNAVGTAWACKGRLLQHDTVCESMRPTPGVDVCQALIDPAAVAAAEVPGVAAAIGANAVRPIVDATAGGAASLC